MFRRAIAPRLLAHARADQVATLYGRGTGRPRRWCSARSSCAACCGSRSRRWSMAVWFAAILANQAWRGVLARAYRRAQPAVADARALGTLLGRRLDARRRAVGRRRRRDVPASPSYQALFIVCLFSVILGGLNLTAVYKPSFYGFVLAALAAADRARRDRGRPGAPLHGAGAGRRARLRAGVRAPAQRRADAVARDALRERRPHRRAEGADRGRARGTRRRRDRESREEPVPRRGEPRSAPAAARDGTVRRGARRAGARARRSKPLVASIHASVEALEGLFAQLLDLSRLEAGALQPAPDACPARSRCSRGSPPTSRRRRPRTGSSCAPCRRGSPSTPIRCCSSASCAISSPTRIRYTRSGRRRARRAPPRRRRAHRRRSTPASASPTTIARACSTNSCSSAAAPRHHAAGRGMGLGLAIVRRLAALLGHRDRARVRPGPRLALLGHRAAATLRPVTAGAMPAGDARGAPRGVARRSRDARVVVIDDDPAVVAAMRALFASWDAHRHRRRRRAVGARRARCDRWRRPPRRRT